MGIQLDKVQPKNKKQLKQLIDYAFKHEQYDLNFIDTSKITDMSYLFSYRDYYFDVSKWDMSNAIDISFMFYGCTKFDCDLSDWDVSNVTDMYSMFNMCENFKGKGLENWDVSKVKDMDYMFNDCDKISIPSWYNLYHRK